MVWLVVSRIYVALAVFQPYRDLEAGDYQSLKFKWRGGESNPGPLAPQAKSLTTLPPPLPIITIASDAKDCRTVSRIYKYTCINRMIHVFRPKGVVQIVLFRIDNLIAVLHLNALDLIDIIPGSVTSCLCFTKNLEEKKEEI